MCNTELCGQCSTILDDEFYCYACRCHMPTVEEIYKRAAEIRKSWSSFRWKEEYIPLTGLFLKEDRVHRGVLLNSDLMNIR